MKFNTICFEQKGAVAYLTISRPKAMNALNRELLKEMESCLTGLDIKSLRVLIIKGAGRKAFVVGADIKEMSRFRPEEAKSFARQGQKVFSLLENLPLPVIALIQGFALGGGLELALACDILIMDEETKIGFPEVTLSLFPAFGGTQRLARAVGFYQAKEMILSGAFRTAQEAYRMGIAHAVVPKRRLLEKAEEYSALFQKRGPLAIARAKRLIQKSRSLSLEKGLEEEIKEFESLFATQDSKEGMEAFIQKRKPAFKGL